MKKPVLKARRVYGNWAPVRIFVINFKTKEGLDFVEIKARSKFSARFEFLFMKGWFISIKEVEQ